MSDDPVPAPEAIAEAQPAPEPSTPEEVEKAEQLIRQARLAVMRKQPDLARKLLEEAVQTAPNSVPVLEAIGDDLVERRQMKKAMETYKAALALDPANVAVERKYAEAVLAAQGIMDPMAMLESGGAAPSAEHFARGSTAGIINLFLPGAGHFMIGQNVKGMVFLALTILGYTMASILPNGIWNLLATVAGKSVEVNGMAVMFLILGVITHLVAITDAVAFAKRHKPRELARPLPLVDKDFEI